MGTLVFVSPLKEKYAFDLVLKYCRDPEKEIRQRFRREVRLLVEFQGNSKVVEIVDSNVEHDPPYFVMRYYPAGDLSALSKRLRADIEFQERTFGQMIDCLAELHARGKFHRDVKPQNFLIHGDTVVVSDFGLSKELDGHTAATRSSQYWGTMGYLPPEFLVSGGFKNADARSDIFMLGKTFYVLLTGRDPTYLSADEVPPSIYTVIERCCETRAESRYKDLATLKQRLSAAYDVLLARNASSGEIRQILAQIADKRKAGRAIRSEDVIRFIDTLVMLDEPDRTAVIFDLKKDVFTLLTAAEVQSHVAAFLRVYQEMVENATYSWSYAEVIASEMAVIFESSDVSTSNRARALQIAIISAVRQHRFAAMDTCIAMIKGIRDDALGHRVAEMLLQYPEDFITNIEPTECRSNAVAAAIKRMK